MSFIDRPSLKVVFLLALVAFIYSCVFFPSIRIFAFAPLLAVFFQRKALYPSLWAGALAGLCTDLLNTQIRFGLFCLCSLLTALVTHRWRHLFYEQRLSSIPLYTILISLIFALFQALFISQYFHPTSLLMPLVDGLYAFLWFTCPLSLIRWFQRRRKTSL